MFTELRNDYYNEDEHYYSIDGWRTTNDNEEGIVVAKVYKNKVTYSRSNYDTLPKVIAIIDQTKSFFK